MSQLNDMDIQLNPPSDKILRSSPLKKDEVVHSGLMYLEYLNPTRDDPFFVEYDKRKISNLDCCIFKFYTYDSFLSWLDCRKKASNWICNRKSPRKKCTVLTYEEYWCNFAGSYKQTSKDFCEVEDAPAENEVESTTANTTTKSKRRRAATIKTGCTARLYMQETKKEPGIFTVAWVYKHSHSIGDAEYYKRSRIRPELREHLKKLCLKNINVTEILNILVTPLLDSCSKANIQDPTVVAKMFRNYFPQSLVVYDYHIKYLRSKFLRDHVRKGESLVESLISWETFLNNDDEKGWAKFNNQYYEKNGGGYNIFSFQFCFKTQIDFLKNNIKLFGIDASHGLAQSLDMDANALFFVLMGIDPKSGISVPLSFMVTNSGGKIVITDWLKNLKEKFNINPVQIALDADRASIASIEKVFPDTKQVLCYFHLLRAVEHNLKKHVVVTDKNERETIHKEIMDNLRKILFEAENKEEAMKSFLDKYKGYTGFIAYFNQQWMSKTEKWLSTETNRIDPLLYTNNLTENFFSIIKNVYLVDYNDNRADTLIYLLSKKVMPRYWEKKLQFVLNLRKRQVRKRERLETLQISDLTDCEIKELVEMKIINSDEIFEVKSFDITKAAYAVRIDYEDKTNNCSCKLFTMDTCKCQHSALVYKYIEIYSKYYFEKIRDIEPTSINLCLNVEMIPFLGTAVGSMVAQELIKDFKMEKNIHDMNFLLMNRTCMSIAHLLNTLPTDQNTPQPRNILDEISNMNDNAGVNNSSGSSMVTSISNTDQSVTVGSSYNPELDDYVHDREGFKRRIERLDEIFVDLTSRENPGEEDANRNIGKNGSPVKKKNKRDEEIVNLLSLPPKQGRNVAETTKIESQVSIEYMEKLQSLIALGPQIDAKGLDTHPGMAKILRGLSVLRIDFLHMSTNRKNLAHNSKLDKKRKQTIL